MEDIDVIAINQDFKVHLGKKISYTLAKRPDFRFIFEKLRNRKERFRVEELLRQAFPGQTFKGRLYAVEHHLAHLSSAFLVFPFEEAVIVSVDGSGDFASSAWGIGRGLDLEVNNRVNFPHYGDEYKVMKSL